MLPGVWEDYITQRPVPASLLAKLEYRRLTLSFSDGNEERGQQTALATFGVKVHGFPVGQVDTLAVFLSLSQRK